jgi:hypothetical protein
MHDFTQIALTIVGTVLGVPTLIGGIGVLVAWMVPKEGANEKADAIASALYRFTETKGNSKLGKKLTDELEQGPIVTIAYFVIRILSTYVDLIKAEK